MTEDCSGVDELSCGAAGWCYECNESYTLNHKLDGIWVFDADGHWQTCIRCNEIQGKAPHSFVELADAKHLKSEATCVSGAVYYKFCSACGYQALDTFESGDKNPDNHDLVHHEAKAPTCTEIGWEAYDACSRCDYTTKVELLALKHDLVHHDAKAPTCTETGTEKRICTVCSKEETRVIAALGHTPGTEVFVDKNDHWNVCKVCHAVVNKTGHTYVNGIQCVCGAVKSEDGTLKRIEVSDTITVPDTLRNNEKLNSEEKIKAELQLQISRKDSKNTVENTAVFDVRLMIITTVDGKQVKTPATKADLVNGKITVLLPYPEAIAANYSKYSFTVAHMVAMADCGLDVGTVEFPAVTKTASGLLVTLTGLSPVAISWTESTNHYYYNPTATPDKTDSANTADDSQMVLWLGSAVLAAAAVVVLTRKKRVSK